MVRQNTAKKRDAARSKAAIIAGAIREFAAHGPAGTRIEEIAVHAGINKSLIYQHFGSKQELYVEALNAVLKRVTEQSSEYTRSFAANAEAGDLRSYIRRYLDNHLSLLESVPEYPRLMAWENLQGGRALGRLQLQSTYQEFLERVSRSLAPLRERGLLKRDFDLSRIARVVMALSHYFVIHKGTLKHLFMVDPALPKSRSEWLDFCTDMLVGTFAQRDSEGTSVPPSKLEAPDNP